MKENLLSSFLSDFFKLCSFSSFEYLCINVFLPSLGRILDFPAPLLLQVVAIHPDIRIVEGKTRDGPDLFDHCRCSGKNSTGIISPDLFKFRYPADNRYRGRTSDIDWSFWTDNE